MSIALQTPSDQDLVDRVKNGDHSAFRTLHERYNGRLLNYVRRFLPDPEEAEDIVQDTWDRVLQKIKTYSKKSAYSTYLFTIGGNLAKEVLRSKRRWNMISIVEESPKGYVPQDLTVDIERDVDERYLAKVVRAAVDSLDPEQSQVIRLRYFDGLSYNEISQEADIPIGTVRSRISRGKEKLERKLRLYRSML